MTADQYMLPQQRAPACSGGNAQVRLEFDAVAGAIRLTVEDDGQGSDRRNPLAGTCCIAR